MKRKRFVKLVMSLGYDRNMANDFAKYINNIIYSDERMTYYLSWIILKTHDSKDMKILNRR